jgi:hypothetical protein
MVLVIRILAYHDVCERDANRDDGLFEILIIPAYRAEVGSGAGHLDV